MNYINFPKRRAISDIVFAYRNIQGVNGNLLSYRNFATQITQILKNINLSISHQAIKNWEDRRNLPRIKLAVQIRDLSPMDWRKDFASDLLYILDFKLFPHATEIAEKALERSLIETGPQKYRYDQSFIQS